MTTLDERYHASFPVMERLGRMGDDGIPKSNPVIGVLAPDQWRIISEACFGTLWTRPALSMEQRSLVTISIITVLRRDDNLNGHIHSGLDIGLAPEQIVEIMLQLIFYTGAPIANTGLAIIKDVFDERGIQVNPYQVYNTSEDPEEMYQRGLAKRQEVLGDNTSGDFPGDDEVDSTWERYQLEYVWGSVWTRPGLDTQSRCICTLTALTLVGSEQSIAQYIRAALRLSLTQDQIREIFFHLNFYIGDSLARKAKAIAEDMFKSL